MDGHKFGQYMVGGHQLLTEGDGGSIADVVRHLPVKQLMPSTPIIEPEVVRQRSPRMGDAIVSLQVDLLILYAVPHAFNEHVINPPALAVHADLNAMAFQYADEITAGKLASLIGIKDLRHAIFVNGPLQRLDAEVAVQGF